jgi:hypothetical protein
MPRAAAWSAAIETALRPDRNQVHRICAASGSLGETSRPLLAIRLLCAAVVMMVAAVPQPPLMIPQFSAGRAVVTEAMRGEPTYSDVPYGVAYHVALLHR